MQYHLFQHLKGTNEYYYAGQKDTGNRAVWLEQYLDPPGYLNLSIGQVPSAVVSGTQVQYIRQTDDAYVAEVDKPYGKVTKMPTDPTVFFPTLAGSWHGVIASIGSM